MSPSQYSMVEELASLVKDNIPNKHLVLALEDALVKFLDDDDISSDAVLELEPMSSYSRMLVHRLADIFGFAHHSVGKEFGRHLVLKCCPETSVPGTLVSDFLCESHSPMTFDVIRRKEVTPGQSTETVGGSPLERRTSYFDVRERIFSDDDDEDDDDDDDGDDDEDDDDDEDEDDDDDDDDDDEDEDDDDDDEDDDAFEPKRPQKVPADARRMITSALDTWSLEKEEEVEELVSLVEGSFRSTYLILAMEDALVKFLRDDNISSDAVLELEPMNPYHRMLIHHLADIFGFDHHSVGKGYGRRLVLECCPETLMPGILVSDFFLQPPDESKSRMTFDVLRKGVIMPGRKRSYFAVRERICSAHACDSKRPREDSADALGQPNKVIKHESDISSLETKPVIKHESDISPLETKPVIKHESDISPLETKPVIKHESDISPLETKPVIKHESDISSLETKPVIKLELHDFSSSEQAADGVKPLYVNESDISLLETKSVIKHEFIGSSEQTADGVKPLHVDESDISLPKPDPKWLKL